QDIYFNPLAASRLARLQAVAARTGLAATDLALAWAIRQPEITTVLVGGRSPAQLASAVRARSLAIGDILVELDAG
ncbi:MAG TPA: aldo/keto reductase, partial [Opitutaceae bacterium]